MSSYTLPMTSSKPITDFSSRLAMVSFCIVSRMFKHISFIHQINSNIAISTHLHLTSFSTHYKTCVNQKIIYLIRSIYFLKSNLFHQTSLLLSLSRFLFLLNKYDITIFFTVISNLYYFIHFI